MPRSRGKLVEWAVVTSFVGMVENRPWGSPGLDSLSRLASGDVVVLPGMNAQVSGKSSGASSNVWFLSGV